MFEQRMLVRRCFIGGCMRRGLSGHLNPLSDVGNGHSIVVMHRNLLDLEDVTVDEPHAIQA